MFFYILYKIGYILANILPLKLAYWLSERFADLHYCIAKRDREAVAANLSTVLKKDIKERCESVRRVFRNFGLYLVDFFRMRRFDKRAVEKRVRIEGIENLDGVLKQNRGAIFLSCHLGNWELGAVLVAIMGYDISVVVLKHRYKNINDFFIGQREKQGVKVITMSSVMKRCVSTLLNKGTLALVGDRDFTNSGVTLDFFGVPTSIPKGPAVLSMKTDSPIVPVFCVRENRFNFRMIFDRPIEPIEIAEIGSDEAVEKGTERFIPLMERYIKAYPEQWLVFRKFWETPVDAFVI